MKELKKLPKAEKKTDVKKTDVKKTDVKKTDVKKTDVKKTDVKKTDVEKTNVKKTDTKIDVKEVDAETKYESKDDNQDEEVILRASNELLPITASPFLLPAAEVLSTASTSKALILVLVGLPASGKSTIADTFCNKMQVVNQRQWQIVNQDVLKTRDKVVRTTETYLQRDQSVIIDRCNFDQEQRLHWIEIAKRWKVPIFCLKLPNADDVEFCLARAKSRGDGNWARIIKPMKKKYTDPSEDEGFSHIFNCSCENDTAIALQALKRL